MRWFYHRKEEKEGESNSLFLETTFAELIRTTSLAIELIIKSLMKKKADKVEEIKKKTGYYSTRDLLEKYDEALRKNVSFFE